MIHRLPTRQVRSPREVVMACDHQPANDPDAMSCNEGRADPASSEADARLLNGPVGWLLITVMAVLWAMAQAGGFA